MKLFFQHLQTFRSTFLTLLFTIPQVLLPGNFFDNKVRAIECPPGTKPVVFNQVKANLKTLKMPSKIATHCAPVSAIGDTVFNDINGNSQQDANEPGIGGVTVYLQDSDGNVISTTTTDSNGKYSFPDLVEGEYTVTVPHPPHGFTPTLIPPNPIDLVGGKNFDDADFGFRPPANGSIGDTVFSDRNGNGIQDNDEPGIPNVVLTLTVPGPDGNQTQTTTTNSNGNYNFNNLPPGDYKVTVTPPADFPQITTGSSQVNVSLQAGQSVTNVDFGLAASNLGTSEGGLRLVKRITAVLKPNGQRIQYNNFLDDPYDNNDNQFTPTPLGQYELLTPLSSGEEVEYTIYFRTGQSLENLNICDLIPAGTSYVTDSIFVTGSGLGADKGRYFSPLTSLEQVPESGVCENRNNLNGTVIVKLGNVSTGQSGTVSFRVKID